MILKSILLTLLFASQYSNAQGVQVMDLSSKPAEETQDQQNQPNSQMNDQNADNHLDHELPPQDDIEALADEIDAQRRKQAAMANAIEKSKEDFAKVGSGTIAEIQRTGEISLDTIRNMDAKTVKFLQDKLREGHMAKIPPEQVRESILAKSKGKPLEKIFTKFPVLLDISVDFVRDPEAMPALLGIFAKKKLLRNYFYLWVVILLIFLAIRLFVIPKKLKGFKKFGVNMCLNMCFTMTVFFIFYQMFYKELSPTVRIIASHF